VLPQDGKIRNENKRCFPKLGKLEMRKRGASPAWENPILKNKAFPNLGKRKMKK